MILATHALVGAAIGKNIDNPWIIIPVSLAVHYVIDSFRHGEYVESFDSKTAAKNTWWRILLDLSAGLFIIGLIIIYNKPSLEKTFDILLGSFSSMFPDLLTLIYWKFKIPLLGKIYKFHSWVHRYPRFSPEREWKLQNARNDILVSLLSIFFLFI